MQNNPHPHELLPTLCIIAEVNIVASGSSVGWLLTKRWMYPSTIRDDHNDVNLYVY